MCIRDSHARVLVLALIRKELGFKFDIKTYMSERIAMAEIASGDLGKTVKVVNDTFRTSD